MYCGKCGERIADETAFCKYCGVRINDSNVPPFHESEYSTENANASYAYHPNDSFNYQSSGMSTVHSSNSKKKFIGIVLACIIGIIIFLGWRYYGPIFSVKNGAFYNYPDQTVGDAFQEFFSEPEWSTFHESGDTYVKFTGGCLLNDEDVRVRILFILDGDEYSIEYYKVGNKKVTDAYAIEALLDAIYE